jgi:hypothetical protein
MRPLHARDQLGVVADVERGAAWPNPLYAVAVGITVKIR